MRITISQTLKVLDEIMKSIIKGTERSEGNGRKR